MKKLMIGLGIVFGSYLFLCAYDQSVSLSASAVAHRNFGVHRYCEHIQASLEVYASEHQGEYPPNLSMLFKENERKLQTTYIFPTLGSGEPHPAYPTGYRKTPFGTQQASSSDIPADPTDKRWMVFGTGYLKNPTSKIDFGAICYRRSGKNNERYDLTGTGKRPIGTWQGLAPWTNHAICVFHAKNY